ncbi:MAG: hypothetical protein U9Q63_04285 [Patescibacteria group bacterium]|nr:hypothetical protein [Patescibacteria group bacterium]
MYGEKEAEKFLNTRIQLVKKRNKKPIPVILSSQIDKQTNLFLQTDLTTQAGRKKRQSIINLLIFWALDKDINSQNIDSHKIRSTIINSLLGTIFQNSLIDEVNLTLIGLKKIVFSRATYLGAKGEPSPIVHNQIIKGVGKILIAHFNEINKYKEQRLNQLTKIKLIKEIQKDKEGGGSLAFSGTTQKNDQYRNKFPLPNKTTHMLISILKHYQFSSWPDSREAAKNLIESIEKQLGFKLKSDLNS